MATKKVSHADWVLRGRTISKRCSYHGISGRWSALTARIVIEFRPSRATKILEPSFKITLKPSPLSDWEDGHLDARITFQDPTAAAASPMLVMIENTADGALVVSSTLAEDAETLVDDLCSGKDMNFILQDGTERLLELPLPNDHSVYELFRKAML